MTVYEGIIIDVEPWVILSELYSDVWLADTGEFYEGHPLKFGEDPVPIERPSADEVTEWLGTWANRVPIVIDHTRVPENISDYPLLIFPNESFISGVSDTSRTTELDLDFSGIFDNHWIDNSYTSCSSNYSGGRLSLNSGPGSTAGANALSRDTWTTSSGSYLLEFDWYPLPGADWYDDDQTDAENKVYFTVPIPTYNSATWAYWDLDNSNAHIAIKLRSSKSNQITIDTSSTSPKSQPFTYSTSHKVKIVLDCDDGILSLYMDDVFIMSEIVSTALTNIGSEFALNFHWHSYNHTVSQRYDNLVLTHNTVNPYPYKIAITKSDGVTQLPVELISFRSVEESPAYATRIPKIWAAEDTKLYLYYDKNQPDNVEYIGATRDSIAQTVWDNNYINVFNLSDTLSTSVVKDSTSTGSNGTAVSLSITNSVSAKVGHAIDFDGSNDYISLPHINVLDLREAGMTFEFYVMPKVYTTGNADRLYQQGWRDGFYIGINSSHNVLFGGEYSSVWRSWGSDFEVPLNEFSYIVVVVDDNNEIKFYKNGQTSVADTKSYPYDTPVVSNYIALAANSEDNDNFFDGEIDFFRRSVGKRSDAWIKVTNYNLNGQLYNIGAVETKAAYYYHGYVTQLDLPVERTVRLYNRDTGIMMDETTSRASDGYYYLTTSVSGSHYVVVLDDDFGDDYNALISDRLGPLGIE